VQSLCHYDLTNSITSSTSSKIILSPRFSKNFPEERLRKRDIMRFGQLAASIPEISRKVLSNQLKSMEKDKLIIRKQYNKIPPHVEYSLTDKSKRLCNVFKTIDEWVNYE